MFWAKGKAAYNVILDSPVATFWRRWGKFAYAIPFAAADISISENKTAAVMANVADIGVALALRGRRGAAAFIAPVAAYALGRSAGYAITGRKPTVVSSDAPLLSQITETALGAKTVQAPPPVSANDDDHNTIVGLSEFGLASRMRKTMTDFGSGYRDQENSSALIGGIAFTAGAAGAFAFTYPFSYRNIDRQKYPRLASLRDIGAKHGFKMFSSALSSDAYEAVHFAGSWKDFGARLLNKAYWGEMSPANLNKNLKDFRGVMYLQSLVGGEVPAGPRYVNRGMVDIGVDKVDTWNYLKARGVESLHAPSISASEFYENGKLSNIGKQFVESSGGLENIVVKRRSAARGTGVWLSAATLPENIAEELYKRPDEFLLQKKLDLAEEFRVTTVGDMPVHTTYRFGSPKMRELAKTLGYTPTKEQVDKSARVSPFEVLQPVTDKKLRTGVEEFATRVAKELPYEIGALDIGLTKSGEHVLIEAQRQFGNISNPVVSRRIRSAITGRPGLTAVAFALTGGALAYGAYKLLSGNNPVNPVAGFDDDYNTIEGLQHRGIAGQIRPVNTEFGSGWRGIGSAIGRSIESIFGIGRRTVRTLGVFGRETLVGTGRFIKNDIMPGIAHGRAPEMSYLAVNAGQIALDASGLMTSGALAYTAVGIGSKLGYLGAKAWQKWGSTYKIYREFKKALGLKGGLVRKLAQRVGSETLSQLGSYIWKGTKNEVGTFIEFGGGKLGRQAVRNELAMKIPGLDDAYGSLMSKMNKPVNPIKGHDAGHWGREQTFASGDFQPGSSCKGFLRIAESVVTAKQARHLWRKGTADEIFGVYEKWFEKIGGLKTFQWFEAKDAPDFLSGQALLVAEATRVGVNKTAFKMTPVFKANTSLLERLAKGQGTIFDRIMTVHEFTEIDQAFVKIFGRKGAAKFYNASAQERAQIMLEGMKKEGSAEAFAKKINEFSDRPLWGSHYSQAPVETEQWYAKRAGALEDWNTVSRHKELAVLGPLSKAQSIANKTINRLFKNRKMDLLPEHLFRYVQELPGVLARFNKPVKAIKAHDAGRWGRETVFAKGDFKPGSSWRKEIARLVGKAGWKKAVLRDIEPALVKAMTGKDINVDAALQAMGVTTVETVTSYMPAKKFLEGGGLTVVRTKAGQIFRGMHKELGFLSKLAHAKEIEFLPLVPSVASREVALGRKLTQFEKKLLIGTGAHEKSEAVHLFTNQASAETLKQYGHGHMDVMRAHGYALGRQGISFKQVVNHYKLSGVETAAFKEGIAFGQKMLKAREYAKFARARSAAKRLSKDIPAQLLTPNRRTGVTTFDGMQHGGIASELRRVNTDFGSLWQELRNALKTAFGRGVPKANWGRIGSVVNPMVDIDRAVGGNLRAFLEEAPIETLMSPIGDFPAKYFNPLSGRTVAGATDSVSGVRAMIAHPEAQLMQKFGSLSAVEQQLYKGTAMHEVLEASLAKSEFAASTAGEKFLKQFGHFHPDALRGQGYFLQQMGLSWKDVKSVYRKATDLRFMKEGFKFGKKSFSKALTANNSMVELGGAVDLKMQAARQMESIVDEQNIARKVALKTKLNQLQEAAQPLPFTVHTRNSHGCNKTVRKI